MKRILSLVLACILMLQAVPMMTFAEETDAPVQLDTLDAASDVAAAASSTEFSSVEELRTLAEKSYSKETTVSYTGDEDLVIDTDLTLPENLYVDLSGRKLTINKGVTFRSKWYLGVDTLEVKGTAHVSLTHVSKLTVNGKLYLNGGFYVHNTKNSAIKGAENIVIKDNGHFEIWMEASTTDKMLTNLNQVLTAPHGWYRYRMMPVGDFVFTKSIALPNNCYMVSYSANSVTINSGCTLTVNDIFYVQKPLTIKGKLANNAALWVLESGSVLVKSGGSYTGNGQVYVSSPLVPSKVLKGLELKNHFEIDLSDAILFQSPAWSRTAVTTKSVASSGKIKLTWDEIYGAKKYEIYRATSKDGEFKHLKTTTSTSYTTGGTVGKTYYYKVRSVSNTGDKSVFSTVVSRAIDLPRPEVTAKNVSSSGKIKLSWKEIEGAKNYEVYRSSSKDGKFELIKTTTSTSYTTGGTAGKTYYYKVKAIHEKSGSNSAYSEIVSCVRELARPDVSIKLSSGKPKLSWKEVDDAKEYAIYRASSKDGTYKKLLTTTRLSWTDPDAKSGKTYYYKVKALHQKSAGNSANSSVVSIKAK